MCTDAQEVMKEFVEGLKEAYIERQLNCEEQWPPVSLEKLVNLQLVEAEKKDGFRAGLPQHGAHGDKVKRIPILHGDLFKTEEGKKPVRKLIGEGNAGIGKTTLCTMLAEEWAEGKILTQFGFVFLLPLRDQLVASAISLSDLLPLYHPDETVCGSVVQHLKRTKGKCVLIIADGWDELDEKMCTKQSFIYNLLFGRLLPSATVLLTSRPASSAPLHNLPTVDRLVEVVGFNEENVKQYIESEFDKCPEKASSLIEELENNPLIMSVCSVPLNCAIICNLWHTLKGVLPKTLTMLYSQVVLNTLFRYLRKQEAYQDLLCLSFDSIPKDLHDTFWLTCKFAYDCLSRDQIVFSKREITSLFPQVLESKAVLCSGLLQCARSLLPVGQGLSFHFVHLTIQEFLAALHLVTLPREEKLKFCDDNARNDRFSMVWRFMFGLGCQKEGSYGKNVVCLDDEVVDRFLSTIDCSRYYNSKIRLLLCHCAVESLNGIVGSKIGKQINGQFDIGMTTAATPHDCVAVFHVLRCILHCPELTINLSHSGLTDSLLNELSDILSAASGKLHVKKLVLYSNRLTDKGLSNLFKRATTSFSTLEVLDLSRNNITITLPLFPSLKNLEHLSLSNNPLGVSGMQSLETAIEEGSFVNLERLNLSAALTDDAVINGTLLDSFLPTIACCCLYLRELDLSENNLAVPGATALGELFTTRNWVRLTLVLTNTNFNAEAVAACRMWTIEPFYDCSIWFNNNSLGYSGLLAVIKMLRSVTCPITLLDLRNTDLTTSVNTECQNYNVLLPNPSNVVNFGDTFESSALTMIYLSNNNFSGNSVFIPAEFLRVCTSLRYFICSSCFLTSSEVLVLLCHLESSGGSYKNLWTLDLSDNSIDEKGGNSLFKSAPKLFPSLETVKLRGNPVNDEVEGRLVKIPSAKSPFMSSSENSNTEDSPAPPSDDDSFHSATEQLDSPVGAQSMDNESTSPMVHFPHGVDQQETSCTESVGMAEITTHPQTSSFQHDNLSARAYGLKIETTDHEELKSCSNVQLHVASECQKSRLSEDSQVIKLKAHTKVTDSQLDTEIEETDMLLLALNFDNVETLSVQLRLTPSQQKDIKNTAFLDDTQTAVDKALRLWRKANPSAATYRALVEIVLRMGANGTAIAEEVCKFLKSSSQVHEQSAMKER